MLKGIGTEKSGEFKAIASGALASGKPVIVNTDGAVVAVASTTVSNSVTDKVEYSANNTTSHVSVYDTNSNRVVVVYRDSGNSDYGTAIVGTISTDSISFGTPVAFESSHSFSFGIAFDSTANKIVISYQDVGDSNKGKAVVGTVDSSDNSISFGTIAEFNSGATVETAAAYDSNANKTVIAYRDSGNSSYGTAVVATVSGTNISFGSETVYESADSRYTGIAYDANAQKVLIVYRDDGNAYHGTAIVGTVSGTGISFGSAAVFEDTNYGIANYHIRPVYDSNANKIVIFYTLGSDGKAIVATISGTSVSFGTKAESDGTGGTREMGSVAFNTGENVIVFGYRNGGDNKGYVNTATVSGTSVSFGSKVEISGGAYYFSCTYSPDVDKTSVAFRDTDDDGATVVFTSAGTSINLTSENYIGISKGGAVADTKRATIDIIGAVNNEQSSLTAGQQYFVQTDGTLDTSADSPSVLAGTAISATELLVKT